jgi:hypothetical protein
VIFVTQIVNMAEEQVEVINRGTADHKSSVLASAQQAETKGTGGGGGVKINLGTYRPGGERKEDQGKGLNEEEKKKRTALLNHIGRLAVCENFAEFLKKRGFQLGVDKLKVMTNEELKDLLDSVETAINGMDGTIGYEILMKGIERV